jgi:hypothetical protein
LQGVIRLREGKSDERGLAGAFGTLEMSAEARATWSILVEIWHGADAGV